jgi:hypothetical protein
LLIDAGEFDASTTGVKTIPFGSDIRIDNPVWITSLFQSGFSVRAAVGAQSFICARLTGMDSLSASIGNSAQYRNMTYGPLPATFSAQGYWDDTNTIAVVLRAA